MTEQQRADASALSALSAAIGKHIPVRYDGPPVHQTVTAVLAELRELGWDLVERKGSTVIGGFDVQLAPGLPPNRVELHTRGRTVDSLLAAFDLTEADIPGGLPPCARPGHDWEPWAFIQPPQPVVEGLPEGTHAVARGYFARRCRRAPCSAGELRVDPPQ